MKKEKGVLLVVLLLGVIMFSVISVNAGFWSKLTGKAIEPAQANVEVTGSDVPPEVCFVSNPNTTEVDSWSSVAPYGKNYHEFSFLAYSVGGPSYFPANPVLGVDIYGEYYGATQSPNTISCSRIANYDNSLGTFSSCPSDVLVNYSCVVEIQYYYDSAEWSINATIKDNGGLWAENHTKKFWLDKNFGWLMVPSSVNWSNVRVGGVAKDADNELEIKLIGNVDIDDAISNPISVSGTKLNGTNVVNEFIPVNNFTVAENNPCSNPNYDLLADGSYVDITPFKVDHRLSLDNDPVKNNLTFCLQKIKGISAQVYRTQASKPWLINAVDNT